VPLAGSVTTLEHDADLQALVLDPPLELDQFDVQSDQLALIVLSLQLAGRSPSSSAAVLVTFAVAISTSQA
jgi:hypothetical protein